MRGIYPALSAKFSVIKGIAQGYKFPPDSLSRLSGSYPLGPGSSPGPKGYEPDRGERKSGGNRKETPMGVLRIFPKAALAGLAKLVWLAWLDWPGLAGQPGLASLASLASLAQAW